MRDAQHVWPMECTQCSLVIHSQPLDHLVDYQSGSMHNWAPGHSDGKGPKPKSDLARRCASIASMAAENSIKSVLDFGSGNGAMVEKFEEDFEAYGLEPDSVARNSAISRDLTIFATVDEIIKSGLRFDLITLFHVIEHLSKPSEVISELRDLLKPAGFCVVETPNSMDALLTLYECEQFQDFTYWSHHPMLHSQRSLEALFSNAGWEITESSGVQRYPIENHLYWLSKRQPGGHEVWKGLFGSELDAVYARQLVEMGVSDTIWLVARKK